MIEILCLVYALSVPSATLQAPTFHEAAQWLSAEAVRVVRGSVIEAHDGTKLFTPDGSAHYRALWTRDFYYMLEGCPEAFQDEEVMAAYRYLLNGQREDGAMPDRVQADGLAVYKPGGVGHGIGPLPATDNPAFMVKLCALICERTRNWDLFQENRQALAKGLDYPLKSEEGLLWIDPENPHSPYGFTDTIFKTGELFFSSVLQWEAYRDMAAMSGKIGEGTMEWEEKADRIHRSLQKFWDDVTGMFRAATVDCDQIDVWGSLYAIYSGLASESQRTRIVKYMVENHEGLVHRGQIRHCAPGEYWERGLTQKDHYQNGGYWATPFGWWFAAVYPEHPDLAKTTFLELIEDFQNNGINEWVLNDKKAVPDYVASACQPLVGLRRMGLDSD